MFELQLSVTLAFGNTEIQITSYSQRRELQRLCLFFLLPAEMNLKFLGNIVSSLEMSLTLLLLYRVIRPPLWSGFLATDTEVSGSIPGTTRFSEWQWVCNGVHSAS